MKFFTMKNVNKKFETHLTSLTETRLWCLHSWTLREPQPWSGTNASWCWAYQSRETSTSIPRTPSALLSPLTATESTIASSTPSILRERMGWVPCSLRHDSLEKQRWCRLPTLKMSQVVPRFAKLSLEGEDEVTLDEALGTASYLKPCCSES